MTTAAQKGNNFEMAIADKYDGTDYTTVAAMTANSMAFNKTSVDITNKDGNGWQELMPGGGIKSISLSGDGIMSGDPTHDLLLATIMGKIAATGTVTFGVNPSNDDEFVFNGVTWTFKTSGASGDETNIKATLALTIDQMVIDMNASATGGLIVATYTGDSIDTITVTFDTIGDTGNAYTLADGSQGGANSTPSGSTLNGGMDQDKNWNFRMTDQAGDTWTGPWNVDTFERTGEVNGAETFSVSMSSADEITYVAA